MILPRKARSERTIKKTDGPPTGVIIQLKRRLKAPLLPVPARLIARIRRHLTCHDLSISGTLTPSLAAILVGMATRPSAPISTAEEHMATNPKLPSRLSSDPTRLIRR